VLDVVIPERKDYTPFLDPVLPWTDVFLPNNDEAETITGLHDPAAQAKCFRDRGVTTAIVTCGSRGCVTASAAGTIQAGPYRVDFVDGTGSGDAFTAGYIHGLLEGADVADCVRMGSALGASCVRATGATSSVFRSSELDSFLKTQPLDVSSFTDAETLR
jgi:sugar/nucleoside kinase (ribokinase family)